MKSLVIQTGFIPANKLVNSSIDIIQNAIDFSLSGRLKKFKSNPLALQYFKRFTDFYGVEGYSGDVTCNISSRFRINNIIEQNLNLFKEVFLLHLYKDIGNKMVRVGVYSNSDTFVYWAVELGDMYSEVRVMSLNLHVVFCLELFFLHNILDHYNTTNIRVRHSWHEYDDNNLIKAIMRCDIPGEEIDLSTRIWS